MSNGKIQLYFWTSASITLVAFSIIFYLASSSKITDLPHDMVLAKASGTLQMIKISKNGRGGSYYARLQVIDRNGTTHLFRSSKINRVRERFRALRPGNQLDITYRADNPDPTTPPEKNARIMEIWADGALILSLDESAALSASIKAERLGIARHCIVAAICALVMAVFLYRNYD